MCPQASNLMVPKYCGKIEGRARVRPGTEEEVECFVWRVNERVSRIGERMGFHGTDNFASRQGEEGLSVQREPAVCRKVQRDRAAQYAVVTD